MPSAPGRMTPTIRRSWENRRVEARPKRTLARGGRRRHGVRRLGPTVVELLDASGAAAPGSPAAPAPPAPPAPRPGGAWAGSRARPGAEGPRPRPFRLARRLGAPQGRVNE